MFTTNCEYIKKELEHTFDIPFEVSFDNSTGLSVYNISPENDSNNLFDVSIAFRQARLIIEIQPQKFANDLLTDMRLASGEKKERFIEYVKLLKSQSTSMIIDINHEKINAENIPWDTLWKYFHVRITKLPFTDDIECYDEKLIAVDWAVRSIGMIISLMNIEQIEDDQYYEGGLNRVETNRYERNPVNRELCLAANGYQCKICGFDFEKTYGIIGHNFIHVHHIDAVSTHKEEYLINPVTDLIPVCPNCHAMLHRSEPPLKPDELKAIIEKMKE